jgi:hypothetical protein
MTIRFLLRNVFQALKIVWGFVFKAATTNADISRELFFDDKLDNEANESFSLHYLKDFIFNKITFIAILSYRFCINI